MDSFVPFARTWPWLAAWCALLLPLAILVPPIPIDETRYLTAAWEMFNAGQWLVPTVNHAWYPDKSPLLFWLIAGGWKIFGVHTWVARVEALAIALGVLLATRRLATRLGMNARGADTAMWLLAGCLGFAIFSTAIMFDLLLSLTVLGALHALLDLDAGKWRRGILWLGVMTGLGLLAKGPVMLLASAGVALLAPLWSDTARAHKLRWCLALLAGLLMGVAILACWLLPAAAFAGPAYWQPLLDKIVGRIDQSFAHGRPWWWYLPQLPILLLPWLLVVRAPRVAWTGIWRGRGGRFIACWWLPPFIAFCAISGKQIHYLLPLLPALALAGAWLLQREGARLRPLLFSLLALIVAAGIVVMPWLSARTFGYAPPWPVALLALVPLVVAVGAWRSWGRTARALALSATALLSTGLLAATLAARPAIDIQPAAAFVRTTLRAQVPIVHVTAPDGLFGYVGRLEQALPWITRQQLLPWCIAHPDGLLLVSEGHNDPLVAAPIEAWPYFGSHDHRITVWRAADILAARRALDTNQKPQGKSL